MPKGVLRFFSVITVPVAGSVISSCAQGMWVWDSKGLPIQGNQKNASSYYKTATRMLVK